MSFFDMIERALKSQDQSTGKTAGFSPGTLDQGNSIETTHTINIAKRVGKPEKLSFLPPCPVCKGKIYIYGEKGGFFCAACCPNIKGRIVEAAGVMHNLEQNDENSISHGLPEKSIRSFHADP